MNAALCCQEPFGGTGARPVAFILRLWRAACLALIAGLRERRAMRATWRGLRLLDERSLAELGVTPGRYWPLDRQPRL